MTPPRTAGPGYGNASLQRADVDVCRATQPVIAEAFAEHRAVKHLKVEDGPGRRLGRSFRVKLWPTLVFMRDGVEVARLVRPRDAAVIDGALREIDPE